MGCSHHGGCPLFPLLNASLGGWRDVYCDSETFWAECARYQRSCRGEPVPMALLPNGHLPIATSRAAGGGFVDLGEPVQSPSWEAVMTQAPPSTEVEESPSRRAWWPVRVVRWLRSPL